MAAITTHRNANDIAWQAFITRADYWLAYPVAPFGTISCTGKLCYGYRGENWYNAAYCLSLAYATTGDTRYSTKAIEVLNALIAMYRAGNVNFTDAASGFPNGDNGYQIRNVAVAAALIYDWCYDQLTTTQKTDTTGMVNAWFDWHKIKAYGADQTTYANAYSNFWGGYILGFGLAAIATAGDNARAAEIASFTSASYDRYWGVAITTGMSRGGYPLEGYNYGLTHNLRILKYLWAVRTNGGTDSATSQAAAMAKNLRYALKPNRFQVMGEGDFPSAPALELDPAYPLALGAVLGSGEEAGFMKWLSANLGAFAVSRSVLAEDIILYSGNSAPAADYTSTPRVYWSPGDNHQFVRSDWTDNAVWASFNAVPRVVADHQWRAFGHVDIARGADYLLIGAGEWQGSAGFSGTPPVSMTAIESSGDATRFNTLFYDDSATNCYATRRYAGCQMFWGTTSVLGHKEAATYTYARADLTPAYDQNQQVVGNRTLTLYHRTFASIGGEVFFVLDRVNVDQSSRVRKLQWHFQPTSTTTAEGDTITSSIGSSKMVLKTVFPAANITVGSDYYRMNVQGNESGTPYAKRVLVQESTPGTSSWILTAIVSTDFKAAAVPITAITGTAHKGAVVETDTPRVAMFSADGVAQTSAAYTVAYAGLGQHVVTDLLPGAYSVSRNGSTVAIGQIVGSDGTLYFAGAAGAYEISKTEAPPVPSIRRYTPRKAGIPGGAKVR